MKLINILLVEDNLSDVRLTEEALLDTGIEHSLKVINDGERAIALLEQLAQSKSSTRPDLILLDLNMPKKNGHAVLETMSRDPVLYDIPVILLTVSKDQEDVDRALSLKMNYYLNKPVNPDALRTLIIAVDALWRSDVSNQDSAI